ncbi:hypothetical protein [Myxococcus sp. AM011]|nr:hypothetical protein [Myxococcus sp. AM011]
MVDASLGPTRVMGGLLALLASWLPARRALQIPPSEALRSEQ